MRQTIATQITTTFEIKVIMIVICLILNHILWNDMVVVIVIVQKRVDVRIGTAVNMIIDVMIDGVAYEMTMIDNQNQGQDQGQDHHFQQFIQVVYIHQVQMDIAMTIDEKSTKNSKETETVTNIKIKKVKRRIDIVKVHPLNQVRHGHDHGQDHQHDSGQKLVDAETTQKQNHDHDQHLHVHCIHHVHHIHHIRHVRCVHHQDQALLPVMPSQCPVKNEKQITS